MFFLGILLLLIGVIASIGGLIMIVVKIIPHGLIRLEDAFFPCLTLVGGIVFSLIGIFFVIASFMATQ
jgi:hypothetical protein